MSHCLRLSLVMSLCLGSVALADSSLSEQDVRAAIVESVRARMGDDAAVNVTSLAVRGAGSSSRIRAVPDAGSKVGGHVRFLLVAEASQGAHGNPGNRLGSADATVTVTVAQVRARHAIGRHQVLAASDLVVSREEVGRIPLQQLPTLEEAVGASAKRHLQAGALVTRSSIDSVTLVRSGDEVTTVVQLGGVEARGRAVAAGTAALGESVPVMVNRRRLRARVIGPRQVEILEVESVR